MRIQSQILGIVGTVRFLQQFNLGNGEQWLLVKSNYYNHIL